MPQHEAMTMPEIRDWFDREVGRGWREKVAEAFGIGRASIYRWFADGSGHPLPPDRAVAFTLMISAPMSRWPAALDEIAATIKANRKEKA